MIGFKMDLKFNGQWEVRQLFPNLQTILQKYPEKFQGTPVANSLKLDGEVMESDYGHIFQ